MDRDSLWEWTRRALLAPSILEDDRSFRVTLARIASTGLQWGGLLGILVVVGLVLINSLALGRPTTWWYPPSPAPNAFVLWDKAVGAVLSGLAVWTGRVRGRLPTARSVGGAIALTVVAVSLTHDVYRGVLSIEYVILTYLLAVAVIPYRPWQALLLGGTITAMLGGLYAIPPSPIVTAGTLIRMGLVTLVLTGVSSLLYVVRLRQYRARQEAERLHRRVARLEQARSQFFADVAHEFRTPLTLILGSLREALDGRLGTLSPDLEDRLASLDDQVQRMRRLVNQLLELSQLDEGRLSLSLQPQPVGALVDHLTMAFRDWAETKGLTFQTEIGGQGPKVWIDPDRFESILATLLSNAIRYTPAGGTVRVRVTSSDSAVSISVRDTGPGLPEAVRARVFERHTSTIPVGPASDEDSPDTPSRLGMGIGLAHTKALVERHQGTLHVESEPGFGTECTVRLPLGTDHVSDDDRAALADGPSPVDREVDVASWTPPELSPLPEEADPPPDNAPTVLVVDDEADMRAYLQRLLRPNYRVVTATNGDDALDRLSDERPDLIISDVRMPGRDGVDLCRALRAKEQFQHLPVILLTAQADDQTRRSGVEAGADACVAKPFDPAELEARVETLIEIRRLVQERVQVPDWVDPPSSSLQSEEADFLESVTTIVDEHIGNSNFGVDWLADELDLSPRHLRRRLKDVTRLSPAGFIRTRRLQHAASLLEDGADTVADVAAAVGYRDASHFSRLFRDTYGCSPSDYPEDAPDAPDIEP